MEQELDAIRERWRRNTTALGIPVTEEDARRFDERGLPDRVIAVERMIESLAAEETTPDYLDILHVGTSEGRHG